MLVLKKIPALRSRSQQTGGVRAQDGSVEVDFPHAVPFAEGLVCGGGDPGFFSTRLCVCVCVCAAVGGVVCVCFMCGLLHQIY